MNTLQIIQTAKAVGLKIAYRN